MKAALLCRNKDKEPFTMSSSQESRGSLDRCYSLVPRTVFVIVYVRPELSVPNEDSGSGTLSDTLDV